MVAPIVVSSMPGKKFQQKVSVGNHTFFSDAGKKVGGDDSGPTPHELVLAGLGACTSMTMKMYADVKDWDLKNVTVKVSEVQGKVPKIKKDISVSGALNAQQVARLKEIAEKCPVNKLLLEDKQMSSTINLVG